MHNSNEIVTNIGLQIATLNVVFNVFKFFNVNVHSEIGITPHGPPHGTFVDTILIFVGRNDPFSQNL